MKIIHLMMFLQSNTFSIENFSRFINNYFISFSNTLYPILLTFSNNVLPLFFFSSGKRMQQSNWKSLCILCDAIMVRGCGMSMRCSFPRVKLLDRIQTSNAAALSNGKVIFLLVVSYTIWSHPATVKNTHWTNLANNHLLSLL